MDVDDATVMKAMAGIAMETAATYFAKKARDFALNLPDSTTGQQALEAFAAAIESTNSKLYPKPKVRQ